MEPPSRQLADLLTQLRLVRARDLRRCRPLVRRLARDLPTFDSVWIDALTQTRVLTPFQAKILESEHPDRLKVGPCILVEQWEKDGRWTLFLAKHLATGRRCVLSYSHLPRDVLPKAREAVRELVARMNGLSHPSLIVPQGCDEHDGNLVVVSPFAAGPTLQQLLVRRGRFPIPVVQELARQLLAALATLEQNDIVHGDLRLTTIRLRRNGQTLLFNPGVLPATGCRVSIHDPLSADAYDGVAPELIGTGAAATLQSDMYALGCLLWQLLAGRPPFPTGDRLGKLAAHQSRVVQDVRRWRPDTPSEIADLLERLTAKDPGARPGGAAEVRNSLRSNRRNSRTRLSTFHASFGAVAPRQGNVRRSSSRFPWSVAGVLLVAMSAVSVTLLDAGARNELLRMAHRVGEDRGVEVSDSGSSSRSDARHAVQPLPPESDDGVIELEPAQQYLASDVQTDRALSIRCPKGMATVVVASAPWRITARSLRLNGLHFVQDDSRTGEDRPPVPVMALRAQQVAVENCRFANPNGFRTGTAIAWKIPDETDPTGGRCVVSHSEFRGNMRALDLYSSARAVGFHNCLKRGLGPLIRLLKSGQPTPLRIRVRSSTLRESGPLVQWRIAADTAGVQPTVLMTENSVFSIPEAGSGLIDFTAAPPADWARLVQITGEGSLIPPRVPLATSQVVPIDTSQLRVDGLVIDDFRFASDEPSVAASQVVATQAPRRDNAPPGIDATHFAVSPDVVREASHAYNGQ